VLERNDHEVTAGVGKEVKNYEVEISVVKNQLFSIRARIEK